MWGIGAAAKRLADDYQLDYGGAHVFNGVFYIVSCFKKKISLYRGNEFAILQVFEFQKSLFTTKIAG